MRPILILALCGAAAFGQVPGPGGSGNIPPSVTSVTLAGTAGQITVTGTCTITATGTCTFNIPSAFILPGTINKLTLTQPATGATLTIADGKTLTANSSVIFTGTDGSTLTFGTGGTLTYTSNSLAVFASTTSAQLASVLSDELGTGVAVFSSALSGLNPSPTTGTSAALTSAITQLFICTGTCTVTIPAPAAGAQYCVYNDNNVATVITLAAIGSSARYENAARTAYGTAGTGTLVSSGAAADSVCIAFRDSTHYSTVSYRGTWVAN